MSQALSGSGGSASNKTDMNDRSTRIARRFELPMLVAALLVIPVIAVEQSDAGEPWRTIAGVLNWTIWVAFAVELVVMLAVVPDRWRWLRSHPLEVVIVLLTPPFCRRACRRFVLSGCSVCSACSVSRSLLAGRSPLTGSAMPRSLPRSQPLAAVTPTRPLRQRKTRRLASGTASGGR